MDRAAQADVLGRVYLRLLALYCAAGVSACVAHPPSGVYACQTSEECPPEQYCEAGVCVRDSSRQQLDPELQTPAPSADAAAASAGQEPRVEAEAGSGGATAAGALAGEPAAAGGTDAAAGSGGTDPAAGSGGANMPPVATAGSSGANGPAGGAAGLGGAGAGGAGTRACSCTGQSACCDGCEPRQESSACEDDGLTCTNDVCRAGKCAHEPRSGSCLIRGKCYANMQPNPEESCQRCDVQLALTAWTATPGQRCDNGLYCDGMDSCDPLGQCTDHVGDPCKTAGGDKCLRCDEQKRSCTADPAYTLYDATTDLLWEVNPSFQNVTWEVSRNGCAGLTLCGRADWRLPTINELRTLINGCPSAESGGSCMVSDRCLTLNCQGEDCFNCEWKKGPNNMLYQKVGLVVAQCDYASQEVADDTSLAWCADYYDGAVLKGMKAQQGSGRCVRKGRLP